jgi:hypothetical protein
MSFLTTERYPGNRPLAWIMLAVWASWTAAAQGLAVAQTPLGSWVPDAGLVLLLACAGRFDSRDVPLAALVVGVARVAYTVEPPSAVLAGFLALAFLLRAGATVAEVDGVLARPVISGLFAWAFCGWLIFVNRVRDLGMVELFDFMPDVLAQWPVALSTALFALFLSPTLAHLPGLSPLRRRRW